MSFLKNTISLMALFSVIPTAYAVTARPSVLPNKTVLGVSATGASRRMPTMTSYVTAGTSANISGGGSATTGTALLKDKDCIDTYTECIKDAELCGTNFEECTNDILFHGKMPQCISTLMQCSASGINSLFGASNISSLNNVATKNSYGEVTKYSYPTDGSILGQMISAAAIENMYDTQSCVRRYTSCLKKESVCGADFELCTTNSEFKKQAVMCDSTLARCQSDGKLELFGNAGATSSTAPSASSRVGEMIAEGAGLAAVNAVSTCYKVVDQCILGACTANPYKCYENSTQETADIVDAINNGTELPQTVNIAASAISKSNIAAHVRNLCMDTIGANKYCYATFLGDGLLPSASQLRDEDNRAEVYEMAYSARMNSGMKSKIADLVNKFDTKAKERCVNTIKSCAMRVCGSGSGAACYSQVFGATDKSINNDYSRNEIRNGCMSIVNTDANCKYAAQNPNASGTYNYSFMDSNAFDVLFPEYDADMGQDPIGVVASLNASLATNYSDAALAKMKKQCQSIATSCVRSQCGNDYVGCYRNRTDIYSSLTNSGNEKFDKSMNKVGGVLDYTVALGLCINTVKNADICSEHLAIEANKVRINKNQNSSWGDTGSVRNEWIDAGSASAMTEQVDTVEAVDENGNALCTNSKGEQGICYTVDATGDIFDTPVTISYTTFVETQAANTLFKDLIYDLEIEAQAKYNAKLTKQQNMCISANNGGIIGNKDLGSSFLWVKLKSNKVPTNYAVAGLKPNQFVASNDLYGSFCRIRVSLQSDNKKVNDVLLAGADWATAYFAAGDSFTCGSWIPSAELEALAQSVADKARADRKEKYGDMKTWSTVIGAVGAGVGGAFLGKGIQDGNVLGGLTGKKAKKESDQTPEKYKEQCLSWADRAIASAKSGKADAASLLEAAISQANGLGVDASYTTAARDSLKAGNKQQTVETFCKEQALAKAKECRDEQCFKHITECANKSTSSEEAADGCFSGCTASDKAESVTLVFGVTEESYDRDKAVNAITELRTQCEVKAVTGKEDEKKESWWKKNSGAIIGGVGGGVIGGVLANKIVGSIQNQELNKVEREAFEEFMNTVGSQIRCVISGETVGVYGDIISTQME